MKRVVDGLLDADLNIINLGLQQFTNQLKKEEHNVIQVAWQPPAGGCPELTKILDLLQEVKQN